MFNRRKIGALVAALAALGAASCRKAALGDGTYTGTGAGRNGDIVVSVTVAGGRVADAHIVSEGDTPEIARPAEERLIAQFLAAGGTEGLDAVSGATLTSNGVLDALDDAMDAARGKKKAAATYADTECDIVVIGAGGAGLVAATEAAAHGAHVIVLEKMGIVGGNTNYSTGGINAAYTAEQERLGIADSTDVFFRDTMAGGGNLNDPALVHALVDNSAATVEWLERAVGADLSDVGIFGGATNKRIHRPQGGAPIGAHLVPLLHKAALANGAEIRLNSTVTDILADTAGTRAAGVRVRYAGGEYTILSRAVIVATGGFGANAAMVAQFAPELAGFGTTNHPGATGDAFGMVEKFGAALTQMEQIQAHPTVVPGNGTMITEAVRGNGAILVNRAGRRFVDELSTRDVVSAAILAQEGGTAFLVFDQGVRGSLKAVEGYAAQGLLTAGGSAAELAGALGIDAEALGETLAEYNGFVRAGVDAAFGRNAAGMERALENPPFYAIECAPAVHHTMGGLKINARAEVLGTDGEPIPALFAAGEVTGGVHGANRLGGNAVADICVFGRIAAASALEYIGQ